MNQDNVMVTRDIVQLTVANGYNTLQLMPPYHPDMKSFRDVCVSKTFYYLITNPEFSQWEVGIGSVNSSNVLSRWTVLDNHLGTTDYVDFTDGTKIVQSHIPPEAFNHNLRPSEFMSGTSFGGPLIGRIARNMIAPSYCIPVYQDIN